MQPYVGRLDDIFGLVGLDDGLLVNKGRSRVDWFPGTLRGLKCVGNVYLLLTKS